MRGRARRRLPGIAAGANPNVPRRWGKRPGSWGVWAAGSGWEGVGDSRRTAIPRAGSSPARIPAPGPAPLRGAAGEASPGPPAGSLGGRVTGRADGGGTPWLGSSLSSLGALDPAVLRVWPAGKMEEKR